MTRLALAALLVLLAVVPVHAEPTFVSLLDCSTAANCSSTTTCDPCDTISFSATGGKLVLVGFAAADANEANPVAPTLTGTNGLNVTWTRVSDCGATNGQGPRVDLFWGVPSSAVAGVLSFNTSGTQNSWGVNVIEVTGADQTTPVVQCKAAGASSGTAASATLDSAYASSNNRPWGFGRAHRTPGTFEKEAGWTDMTADFGHLNGMYAGAYRTDTSDTSLGFTISTSSNWVMFLAEIAAAASSAKGGMMMMGCCN